jgi:hypothetical protein
MLGEDIAGHSKKGVYDSVCLFSPEIVGQLGKRGKIGKKNGQFDHPTLLNMRAASVAEIRIARAALDPGSPKD